MQKILKKKQVQYCTIKVHTHFSRSSKKKDSSFQDNFTQEENSQ